MNMNKLSERTIIAILFIALFIAYGMAGTEDYNQAIIEAMPDEAYVEIVQKLGYGCSNRAIVSEYESNRVYYDSLDIVWN